MTLSVKLSQMTPGRINFYLQSHNTMCFQLFFNHIFHLIHLMNFIEKQKEKTLTQIYVLEFLKTDPLEEELSIYISCTCNTVLFSILPCSVDAHLFIIRVSFSNQASSLLTQLYICSLFENSCLN